MRSSRDLDANVRKIKEYLGRCAEDGVKVVVFPECALTGYFDDGVYEGFLRENNWMMPNSKLAKACRKHRIYAIVGTPHRDGERLYNSAVVITPEGNILARYHKVQLAESWPVAGDELIVFKIDGVPASIIICHDERYPELVRLPVLAGPAFVFYVSHESGLAHESKIVPYRPRFKRELLRTPYTSSKPTRRPIPMPRARTAKAD